MKLRDLKTAKERRVFVEKQTNTPLSHISKFSIDEFVVGSKNCENMIGVTQVPLGIAGPLKVKNCNLRIIGKQKEKTRNYFIPLATTEGALVASVSRGCKTITESGGAISTSKLVGVTRGVVFQKSNNLKFIISDWLQENFNVIKKQAESTSVHLVLLKYDIVEVGKYIYIRWYFDTGDAMGMNMATIASQKIVEFIERETNLKLISVSGNNCVDKKPSFSNFINGRGKIISSEIVIPRKIVSSVLKTTSQKIEEVWKAKCMVGSAISGSLGFNAHYANVISAIFIATGQDPAHVVEGSMGITIVDVQENGDLYISVSLPSLMIGTVGGGTMIATQRESLEIMGVYGDQKADEFSCVVAGAVLAGEVSLLASLSEGTLAGAHKKLAR